MKGEYVKSKNENTTNMFSKFHHPFSHHFHLSGEHSESDDTSRSTGGLNQPNSGGAGGGGSGGGNSSTDGASIEIGRRPRGRPPGSKNKPKPTYFVARDADPPMSPYILEVSEGNDIVEAISRFCRRKNIGICVLTASGAVANVTLRQPSTNPGATVTFHGRFDILSISATFLPPTASSPPLPHMFAISLAGPQGQIVGGSVASALIAAGSVYVVAASFNSPSYDRLPVEVEDEERNFGSGDGGGDSGDGQSPPVPYGGECRNMVGGGDSGGMSLYNCHMAGSDVIWAPTARPAQPPPSF